MGYNTVAVIMNDYTHEIRKSGHLGMRISDAMIAAGSSRCQHHERSFVADHSYRTELRLSAG